MSNAMVDRKWSQNYWNYQDPALLSVGSDFVLHAAGPGGQVFRGIEVPGGATIRFSCLVKQPTGAFGRTFVFIDSPVKGPAHNKDIAHCYSREYEELTAVWTAPIGAGNVSAVIGVGISTGADVASTAEFLNPRIEIVHDALAAPRTVAMGVLRNTASTGGWQVHTDFCNFGIKSVSKASSPLGIAVELDVAGYNFTGMPRGRKPFGLVSSASEATNFFPTIGLLSGFDGTGNLVANIFLVDPATKTLLDPDTLTNHYVAFEIKMI